MAEVGWIVTYDGQSGGNWVRRQVVDGLSDVHAFENVLIEPGLEPSRLARSVWDLATYDDPETDLWVEAGASLALRAPGRRKPNVLLLHHLPDPEDYRSVANVAHALKKAVVLRRLREADRVVVVSDFWREYLADRGVEDNVTTVYNGLPVERFDLDPDAVAAWRERLCDDPATPLVHVGPCAPGKGGHRAYDALSDSDLDAEFVTTGRKSIDRPVRHVNPSYGEYLEVLAACDVLVAMSTVPEGGGLQVQEAMLCGTPVVGSGRGGMRTLLDGGDQVTCRSFADLPAAVERALAAGDEAGARGRAFAEQFTRDRMVEGYRSVFASVLDESSG